MINIVNGLHDHNEYFIFRDDNKEVKINVSGGYIKANHILKPKERKHINEIILMRDNWESPEDEEMQGIYNLAEQGFTDYYISDKLNISFNYTVQMTTGFWRKRMKK